MGADAHAGVELIDSDLPTVTAAADKVTRVLGERWSFLSTVARARVPSADELPHGPIELRLTFWVGPHR